MFYQHAVCELADRASDSGSARGLGVKFPGSILTSRTETSSLSRVVGWWRPMLCTVKYMKKVSYGRVFDLAVEQSQLFRNYD